jgi:hypothetical protein
MTIFCNHCRMPVYEGVRLASNDEWRYFHDDCWEQIPLSNRTFRIVGHFKLS